MKLSPAFLEPCGTRKGPGGAFSRKAVADSFGQGSSTRAPLPWVALRRAWNPLLTPVKGRNQPNWKKSASRRTRNFPQSSDYDLFGIESVFTPLFGVAEVNQRSLLCFLHTLGWEFLINQNNCNVNWKKDNSRNNNLKKFTAHTDSQSTTGYDISDDRPSFHPRNSHRWIFYQFPSYKAQND